MVVMTLTDVAAAVDCATCGMHMSTDGTAPPAPDQPFGAAVDDTGTVTELADSTDLLTHYADLICVREDCPHRTP
jgi:hypothetical protein